MEKEAGCTFKQVNLQANSTETEQLPESYLYWPKHERMN